MESTIISGDFWRRCNSPGPLRSYENRRASTARTLSTLLFCPSVNSMMIILTTSGDSSLPIIYSVERVRDGRSFATRTVRSLQRGAVIFVLTSSFHKYKPSPLAHGMHSPVHLLPGPETIRTPTPDEYAQYTLRRLLAAPKKPTLESKTRPIVARAFANSEGFVKDMREE